jgi:hypothetical protein
VPSSDLAKALSASIISIMDDISLPLMLRMMHSEVSGSTGASKVQVLGEFSGADMLELLLG